MTVSYSKDVASSSNTLMGNNMIKLLFRWKGSVYRLIWDDCIVFLVLYAIISAIYRYVLEEDGRKTFELLVVHFDKFSQDLPLTWILGFYVGIVVKRWWEQFKCIPCPDHLAFMLNAAMKKHDDHSKMTRRTIIRYLNLGITIALSKVLDEAHNPYRTLDDLVEEGLLMEDEKQIFEDYRRQHGVPSEAGPKKRVIFKRSEKDPKPKSLEEFWIPLTWANSLIITASLEGLIKDDFARRAMIGEILNIRNMCNSLLCYDWINVPLVYTQVVTIAVYSFFVTSLLGSQFLEPGADSKERRIDFYLPVFTILKFIFYIGWLKVAETLLNPFGGDDDDFEISYLIKRNREAGYALVEDLSRPPPQLKKDPHWNKTVTEQGIDNIQVRKSMRRKSTKSINKSKKIEYTTHAYPENNNETKEGDIAIDFKSMDNDSGNFDIYEQTHKFSGLSEATKF